MKKTVWTITCGLVFSGLAVSALAQTNLSPKAQYAAESRQAQQRYSADKRDCNDEASSTARLQCRRDAKSEYNKAMADARAHRASQAANAAPAYRGLAANPAAAHRAQAGCPDCARVTAVNVSTQKGEGGAVGLIAGGVAGALLGHQVGGGRGKDLATVAGAAGGAYAGQKIEENVNSRKIWTVSVQYQDGRKHSFNFEQDPGFRTGDAVRNSGNSIARQ